MKLEKAGRRKMVVFDDVKGLDVLLLLLIHAFELWKKFRPDAKEKK